MKVRISMFLRRFRVASLGSGPAVAYKPVLSGDWRPRIWRQPVQNDVTYLAIMFALFAVSVLFVKACDKLIGPDEEALGRRSEDSREAERSPEQEAA